MAADDVRRNDIELRDFFEIERVAQFGVLALQFLESGLYDAEPADLAANS